MPRLMSVALTEAAVVAREKTVTRRLGWQFLRPGDRLTLCRKVMGRRKGDPLVRLAEVEVLDVNRQRLDSLTWADVEREGFPGQTPDWFVTFFCNTHRGCTPETVVTRIEWKYIDAPDAGGSRPKPATVADVDPVEPREGSPATVVWWKVCHRNGGWNVVGLDVRDEIAYECLHLHLARADGIHCGRRILSHAEGPSQ